MADRAQMMQALRNAHKAGDVAAAKRIAGMIQSAPAPAPAPSAPVPIQSPNIPQLPAGYGSGIAAQPPGMTTGGLMDRYQMEVNQGRMPQQIAGSVLLQAGQQFMEWGMDNITETTPQEAYAWINERSGQAWDIPIPKSLAEAFTGGMEAISRWAADNPEKARGIEAALTGVGMGGPAGKAIPARQLLRARKKAAVKSVTPYMNEANKKEMFADRRLRPAKGMEKLRRFTVFDENHPIVRQQIEALDSVPGFSPYQDVVTRHDLVVKEIINASEKLQGSLDDLGKTRRISRKQLNQALRKKNIDNRFNFNKRDNLEKSEFINPAERAEIRADLEFRLKKLQGPDGSISIGDIHRERKLLDRRYRNAKNPRRLAGDLQPTRDEIKWRVKRDILNEMVDRVAPGTKTERARMKTLYDVREILEQKATKGHISTYDAVSEHLPFIGNTSVRINPGVRN